MKYYEILSKNNLINLVLLVYNGIKLPSETAANIVLLKVSYNSLVKELQKSLEEIFNSLKKEGYDDRALRVEVMYDIENKLKKHKEWHEGMVDSEGNKIPEPYKPSEEDIKKVEDTKTILKDFEEEKKELLETYEKAALKKYMEDVPFNKGLTKEDWKAIYEIVGVDTSIMYRFPNGIEKEIKGELFMQFIGELIND